MMQRRKFRFRKGFTFVEIMVVVVIIGLLATIIIPRALKGLGKAKRDIARSKMTVIEDALGRFYLDCGRYPSDSEGLEILAEKESPSSDLDNKFGGPYLKRSELLDPWERPYLYVAEGTVNAGSFDLISYGADGVIGGEGDNQDIVND